MYTIIIIPRENTKVDYSELMSELKTHKIQFRQKGGRLKVYCESLNHVAMVECVMSFKSYTIQRIVSVVNGQVRKFNRSLFIQKTADFLGNFSKMTPVDRAEAFTEWLKIWILPHREMFNLPTLLKFKGTILEKIAMFAKNNSSFFPDGFLEKSIEALL